MGFACGGLRRRELFFKAPGPTHSKIIETFKKTFKTPVFDSLSLQWKREAEAHIQSSV